jgi:hypothetical protein
MSKTFTMPTESAVVVNKTGRTYTIDWSRVPESSIEFFLNYGLEQKFNDSHSSITQGGKNPFKGTQDEFEMAVHDITDDIETKIYAGTLGTRARRVEDPKKVTARTLAAMAASNPDELAAMLKAAGIELPTKKKAA